MKTGFDKISLLLASANLTSRDILHFVESVERLGPGGLVNHVEELKGLLNSLSLEISDAYHPHNRSRISPSMVSEKVERLLLDEAGLAKRQAIELLTLAIHERHPGALVPIDSRKGFSAWVGKLADTVSESELLYIATTIRNRFVHEAPSDWRLK